MLRLLPIRCLAAVFTLLCACAAFAGDEPAERPFQTERDDVAYTVNADGSYVEQHDWAIRILKDSALEYAKQTSVSYSTSIQKADVLAAYTLKPDGRRIDVPKSNFQVETNGGKGDGGPMFSDYTTLSVVFPELATGDTAVFSYKVTASRPMFDGAFSIVDGFASDRYYGESHIRIDAPASLWTQYHAWGVKETRNEVKGDRRLLEWTYRNTSPKKDTRSDAAVFDPEKSIGVAYSTFHTYADIAAAYGKRALPKAAVTPRIQALADATAAGRQSPRETAQALYEWVSTHITYAGNCIGLGAVVPHDLDFVLDNKMGDCKDHATLLQALLAAKGIESRQVLINAGNVFKLPGVPVASMVNHVFNYIPSLDLYADATAKGIPFGLLPQQSMDKPILVVGGTQAEARTPRPPVGGNRQRMVTRLRIAADGSVTGNVDVSLTGMYAIAARAGFRDVPEDRLRDMVKEYYKASGYVGSGTFTQDDPKPLTDTWRYGTRIDVKEMLPIPGAFSIKPVFMNVAPIAHFASVATEEVDADNETTCRSGYSEEDYEYTFPDEVRIVATPPDATISSEALDYRASYRLDGHVLKVKRVLDDRTPGALCTPAFNAASKEFAKKVLANLKAQVVYQ